MRPGSSGSAQEGKGHNSIIVPGCIGGEAYRNEATFPEISCCRVGGAHQPCCARSSGQDMGVLGTSYLRSYLHVFDRTEDIPYIHKPNLMDARARGLAVINTDSLGLRAKIAGATYGAKHPNEYRIAVVGDSCTFGEGVTRTEDTFAQVLEDTLNQRQQAVAVKVLNFGASAYSVKQMAATLQYRMVDTQPDLVMMAIIPSDFNLARTPTVRWHGVCCGGFTWRMS